MSYFSSKDVITQQKKKFPWFFMLLFIFFIALSGGIYWLYNSKYYKQYSCYIDESYAIQKVGGTDKASFVIPQGSDIVIISNILKNNNVIENEDFFQCYMKKHSLIPQIQAGYFEIQLPISTSELGTQLKQALKETLTITIQEGLRYDEIGNKIESILNPNKEEGKFLAAKFITLAQSKESTDIFKETKGKKNLEGFLFPDTYFVERNVTEKEIIELLTKTFTEKIKSPLSEDFTKTKLTYYEVIILASIIEKESGKSYEEKQMIADLLLRRMKSNWSLDVDATFLYEKKNWKYVITIQDKQTKTPYNTYLNKGLPPTPICNPGFDSIKAVLNPKSNKYWYYLHDNNGQIHFSVTYQEHLNNISKYLR